VTARAFLPPVYLGPEDPELAEAPYDELSRNFIGIPSPEGSTAEKSSGTQTDYQWEIERLEREISAMLAEARQDPSTDPLELDRDLRNLSYRIDMLRLAVKDRE
jgi:hypothetical protein